MKYFLLLLLSAAAASAATLRVGDAPASFSPSFEMLYAPENPKLDQLRVYDIGSRLAGWNKAANPTERTALVHEAASVTPFSPAATTAPDGTVTFAFPENDTASVSATLAPSPVDPKLTFTLTAKKAGWFSLGFTGAPAFPLPKIAELYQPLIWQEKRLPGERYLSIEAMATFPGTLVESDGWTYGVIADPAAIPFRMPNMWSSKFGLMLRDADGNARPQIFAPVLGAQDSFLQAGETRTFSVRFIARQATLQATARDLTTSLYGFKNRRENATASLNETLENLIRFQMDDRYSGWNADLKGFDYKEDVLGTVKVVSALQPLSAAIITDNEEIFDKRALPMTEYLLSRQKYLFSFTGKQAKQDATTLIDGPAMEVSELAALYSFSGDRSPVFLDLAEQLNQKDRILNLRKVSRANSFVNLLALYRATGDKATLERAKADADTFLATRMAKPEEAISPNLQAEASNFPSDFNPPWIDLFELYEATNESRYLDAAVKGARDFALWLWIYPVIPEQNVTVYPDGKSHESRFRKNKLGAVPFEAKPQQVPAWRLSQIGLMPESSSTVMDNPAVLLAHHAPYFMRLARAAHDPFFYELARSAVVGRYTNYPGYDINYEFTTLFQRPDYPLHEYPDFFTYNQMYYNHGWQLVGILIDYLVSDAAYRSGGQIDFPSDYAQGYAYLQSKVYGRRPGTIFGEHARLWMPAKMLRTDNLQINYLAARGDGNFHLALMNESDRAQTVTIQLQPDIVPFDSGKTYPLEFPGSNHSTAVMTDGRFTTDVPPHGLTTVKIVGLDVPGFFQDRWTDAATAKLGADSHAVVKTPAGDAHLMILSLGRGLSNAFIWLASQPDQTKAATLKYRTNPGENWQEKSDKSYPLEFSIPLPEDAEEFEWSLKCEAADGKTTQTEGKPLSLKAAQ